MSKYQRFTYPTVPMEELQRGDTVRFPISGFCREILHAIGHDKTRVYVLSTPFRGTRRPKKLALEHINHYHVKTVDELRALGAIPVKVILIERKEKQRKNYAV